MDYQCKYQCLKTCNPLESLYCIADALIEAVSGNVEDGLVFASANVGNSTPETCLDANGKFITVKTLMERLSDEYSIAA